MSEAAAWSKYAAVILAAGASTRLRQPKQLLEIDGESLLRRTIRLAADAGCGPIFVVLGFESGIMRREVSGPGTKAVLNPEWQSGMGASLRCGIEALSKEASVPERTMVLLCDQAKLSAAILRELITTSLETNSLITASRYADRLGVPAVFRKQIYPELLKIEGERGARAVIQRHLERTSVVEFPEGAVDIDTPADLANLI